MNEKLLFTRENTRIDGDINFDFDCVWARIITTLNIESKFDIKLKDNDELYLYIEYYPDKTVTNYKDDLILHYYINNNDLHFCVKMQNQEKTELLSLMNSMNIEETGMTILEYWNQIQNEEAV